MKNKTVLWIWIGLWILQLPMTYLASVEAHEIKACDNRTMVKSLYENPVEGWRVVVQGVIVLPETTDELKMLPQGESPTLLINGDRQFLLTITDVPEEVVKSLKKLSYTHNPDQHEYSFPNPYQNAQATQRFVTITGKIHYIGNDTIPVIVYMCHTVEDYGL